MTSDIVISVKNLSKVFKVYHRPTDMFRELITGRPQYQEYWALQDVSFEVKRGETFGIIGRNGAGKSTLLKILAGTLDKSAGDVETFGKVSAILELGSGFNGDYTGRENIFMGGMCLGMSRNEIARKVSGIIEFSELGEVIDRPFKTYSSGMQARLTFAVAISVDPDVFIIDEALAAGDAYFVTKCLYKINEICRSGKTVCFVSHATNLVETFCQRCIWLERGRIMQSGNPAEVTKRYLELIFSADSTSMLPPADKSKEAVNLKTAVVPVHGVAVDVTTKKEKVTTEDTGTVEGPQVAGLQVAAEQELSYNWGRIKLTKFELLNKDLIPQYVFRQGEKMIFRFHFQTFKPFGVEDRITASLAIHKDGFMVGGAVGGEWGLPHLVCNADQTGYCDCIVEESYFGAGDYLVSAGFVRDVPWQKPEDLESFYRKHFSFRVIRSKPRPYNYLVEHPVKWLLHCD